MVEYRLSNFKPPGLITWGDHTTMLLLVIVDSAVIGGVARVVVNLARGLRARQWDVRTVFPSWADAEFVTWCRNQDLDPEMSPALAALSHVGLGGALRGQLMLRSLIREADASVVNFHYSGSIISPKDILAARLARVPRCVASVHLAARWNAEGRFRKQMTAAASTLADRVVAVSGAVANGQHEAGVPRSKITVIPNGVRRPEPSLTRAEARDRLGLSSDQFVVGAAARLVPVKRLHDLVDAIGILRGAGVPARALIAGEGPERARLEGLASGSSAAGAVDLLGYRSDPADVYLASDAVVLPSELEGQPLTALEAAFYGKPCVATAIGGTIEVVEDGVTGFLVPVGAPHHIADRLMLLYRDPSLAARIGAAAKARAEQEFTVERMVARYESVLAPATTQPTSV